MLTTLSWEPSNTQVILQVLGLHNNTQEAVCSIACSPLKRFSGNETMNRMFAFACSKICNIESYSE